jgi:hypothetical protein
MPNSKYRCGSCGSDISDGSDPCPRCGASERNVTVFVEGVAAQFRVADVGTVAERNFEDAHEISVRTPLGATSEARQTQDGVEISVGGRLDVGRPAERNIQDILVERIRSEGIPVVAEEGAEDSRGEDGLLVVDGHRYTLQATTVPKAPTFWQDLRRSGSATTEVSNARAAEWIHDAIDAKAAKLLPRQSRAGIILALDARHAGVIAGPLVKAEYSAMYGAASVEFGFEAIWIVGPTPSNCSRL